MRLGLFSTCSAALLGALVCTGTADAQNRPAWVDPPAKAEPGRVDPKPEAGPAATAPAREAPQGSQAQGAGSSGTAAARSQAAPAEERSAEVAPRTRRSARHADSRGRSPRRLSQVPPAPLPLTVSPGAGSPGMAAASEERFPEWAARAQSLSEDYLDAVSSPGEGMVAAAPRFYAERVRFHGRTLSLAALMAEKRRFVRRWPERRYVAQGDSVRTACNAATATCIVRSTFDFRADNPRAGARSQGVAELVLEISVAGPRPVIVGESSRVLRRYAPGPVSAGPTMQRGA